VTGSTLRSRPHHHQTKGQHANTKVWRRDSARLTFGLAQKPQVRKVRFARWADVHRKADVRKVPKPEISPKTKPLDARAVRFFRAAQRIRLVSWQRLSDLASVLGEQQRHQLIDRCRQVAAGRGATFLPLARRAGWPIVNLGIIASNKWKALMNVCAMVRSVAL
jgi:hypothetical protein